MVTRLQEETHEAAVLRLAEKARESGVRLVRDRTGRYYASSASTPGTMHFVTAFSCDCKGFVSHQRCMHNSALLVAMGFVPADPEPEPTLATVSSEPTPCDTCQGRGTEPGTVSDGRGGWRYDNLTCSRCHGTGQAERLPVAA